MVTTKHCCWGECKSDSRAGNMGNIYFIGFGNGFPKPNKEREKCLRWVESCGRKYFTIDNVKKDTYICSLHFVGGYGPTDEFPDPIKCGKQVTQKRKAPTEKPAYKSPKQRKLDIHEAVEGLLLLPETLTSTQSYAEPSTSAEQFSMTTPLYTKSTFKDIGITCKPHTENKYCQTEKHACSELIKVSIQNKLLQNNLKIQQSEYKIKESSSEAIKIENNKNFS